MRRLMILVTLLTTGCVVEAPPPRVRVIERPVVVPSPSLVLEAPGDVVSVYIEPPLGEPEPLAIGWAPPPMLVEAPPIPPFADAIWVGGYWVWEGDWVWARGHWMAPPRPGLVWVHPYYEHRDGVVLFITGYWSPREVLFVPPRPGLRFELEIARVGVRPGPKPIGPDGCFVPPPPGSRRGLIVPAPIGTPPAVVTSAPPIVAVGMRINANISVHNTTVINQVTHVTNVTIVAPASATANGRAVSTSVPAEAHVAAALPAVVHSYAPEPATNRVIPAYYHGRANVALPQARAVSNTPVPTMGRAPEAAYPAVNAPKPEAERVESRRQELQEPPHGTRTPEEVRETERARQPLASSPEVRTPERAAKPPVIQARDRKVQQTAAEKEKAKQGEHDKDRAKEKDKESN